MDGKVIRFRRLSSTTASSSRLMSVARSPVDGPSRSATGEICDIHLPMKSILDSGSPSS
ncbi:Uncharacterised protein [Bordetella pertussis]|nr:Uncharacterised protein [Bordetella pertussis]